MARFSFFILWVQALVSFTILGPVAGAQTVTLASLDQKLAPIAESSKRILFVDIDNTIGIQDEFTGKWILYDGALDFLHSVQTEFSVVLFTANIRENIIELFRQFPVLYRASEVALTAEDFAPSFAALIHAISADYKKLDHPTTQQWRDLLFAAWKKSPNAYLPFGTTIEPPPITTLDWQTRVYFPYISPDKTPIVTRYHAVLVDDRFGNLAEHDKYRKLAQDHQGIYSGPVGGFTQNSGPDYLGIIKLLHDYGCAWMLAGNR